MDCIHDFHNLECAIRTNDLFLHALTPIINLFFATNHMKYSRWLSQFQLDLLNIDSTHSGLRDILSQGTFTVCRTSKSFNRSSVDLALEQTVNADEASRLTGISAATNNYSTPLRWMVTKSSRAVVVSITQDMAGLFGSYDPIAEMRPSRIKRATSDVQKVLDQSKESCNPFCSAVFEKLYNRSGKAVSTPVQSCLLAIRDKGKLRYDQFIEDCLTDANNFEKSIKKENLETFKLECKSNKRHPDKKVAACSHADLMGRLVMLASKKELDLEYVFRYPFTPVPLSLCCSDGMMAKTEKRTLFSLLEKKVPQSSPGTMDAYVIDGQFLLHTLHPNIPGIYGGLAACILMGERARKGLEEKEYIITGPEQHLTKRNTDLLKFK